VNYLMDTVTITRHFSKLGKVGGKAKRIIKEAEEGKHHLFISVVSLFEIMYLAERNRIKISLKASLDKIHSKSCYSIVDLNADIILAASRIQFYELHDRLILATTQYMELEVLSSDERFDEVANVKRFWS
jgi:PIN domain nuclease of toxin-antitoxin system